MSRSMVRALTECAIADAHMSPTCSITVFQILVDAMASGTLDSGTTYSSLIFLNRLAVKWLSRSRWLMRGPIPILDPQAAAIFAVINSDGAAVYRSCLTVLRGMTDLLLQYSTAVVCEEVCVWLSRPGFLVVLEMLHRGEHSPRGPSELATSIWTIAQALLCVMNSIITSVADPPPPFTAVLDACISIAGTLHKLVNMTVCVTGGWSDVNYSRLGESCRLLCDTVKTLLMMHSIGADLQEGRDKNSNSSPDNLNSIMRLSMLLNMSVRGVLGTLHRCGLTSREYQHCLKHFEDSAIQSVERLRNKHRMMRVMNGRILPGCCNPSCVQLSGVTETALKTLLCSGCRRMLYCSQKCQKAHFQSGHGQQCGVGWWGLNVGMTSASASVD